jgi:hypothetical protein
MVPILGTNWETNNGFQYSEYKGSLGNLYSQERKLIMRVSQNMGKNKPSDEDIRTWIKEGSKFTKRTKKGHIYITRRKGANKERSLGRFKQSLWEKIEKISREPEEPQRETDPLSIFYTLVELNRSALISQNCLHRDDEGFCTYWRWSPEYSLLNFRRDLVIKEVKDEGKTVYLFYADFRYCKGCTAYTSVKLKVSKF